MYNSSIYFSRGNSFFPFWIATVHAHNPFPNVNLDIIWDFLFYSFFSWITMVPQFQRGKDCMQMWNKASGSGIILKSQNDRASMSWDASEKEAKFWLHGHSCHFDFFDHLCKTFSLILQLSLICFYSHETFMDSTLFTLRSFKTCS